MCYEEKNGSNIGAREIPFKVWSERVPGSEYITAEGSAMQMSCGKMENSMFEKLKECQCGWRVVSEGKQVRPTLRRSYGTNKDCSFCPKIKGFWAGEWKQQVCRSLVWLQCGEWIRSLLFGKDCIITLPLQVYPPTFSHFVGKRGTA